MLSVCIIGAGPCGLSALYAFEKELSCKGLHSKVKLTCFEKQNRPGGLWNYTWKTGLNEFGETVHSSQYHHLWSNGPKETIEFPHYTWKQHFGIPVGSYPPRIVVRDYFLGRIKNENKDYIKKYIKLLHKVESVIPIENNLFEVTYKYLKTNQIYKQIFSHIIVATGHYSIPNIPSYQNIKGINEFSGSISHSHDFRDANIYKNKHVLIIGSSYSAEDIALQLYKFGCKQISVSYRSGPMRFKWPNNIKEYPLLKEIKNGNDIYFIDDSYVTNVDAIILCTGYKHSFPFMEKSICLVSNDTLYPNNLFEGVVWIPNTSVFYLGFCGQYYSFTMFDCQAFFARDIILNKIKLPNKNNMLKHFKKWKLKTINIKSFKDEMNFQTKYISHLCKYTNYVNDINKLNVSKLFIRWEHDRENNILTYRDKVFTSIHDGTKGIKLNTNWLNAMDDSLNTFVNNSYNNKSKL